MIEGRTPRLLIVDDDAGLRELIGGFLEEHGYGVVTVDGVAAMRRELDRAVFDLVVLDVMMPGEDGLSALRSLAGRGPPVVMLSAMGGEVDRIVGLELGADDYVPKPCNPRELLARIRAVLRRRAGSGSDERPVWRFAGFTLDVEGWRLAAPAGATIDLSDGEIRLLKALAERPRRVVDREALILSARGADADAFDRAIDVAISRLRRKLEPHGGAELIRTVRGEGYLLTAEVERSGA